MDEQGAGETRLAHWIALLGERDIPVLQRSVDALARLRPREDTVNPRELSQIILRDPMLTLTVVRHLQTRSRRRKLAEITTVEHAVMMLGITPFFAAFSNLPAVEDALRDEPQALAGLMRVVSRARTAALYAGAWAARRADIETDEVVVAALLHDMAELLMWCFAPVQVAAIAERKRREPGLRSSQAQQEALGFTLSELQLALAQGWQLPALLTMLMDDAGDPTPRVANVRLAVALARHTAEGWSNPALPDDIEGAARLLKSTADDVYPEIFDIALHAVAEREWYGDSLGRACLPCLPSAAPGDAGASAAERRAQAREDALFWLRCLADGVPLKGHPRQGMVRDGAHDALAAIAAALDAVTRGLGMACGVFLSVDPERKQIAAKYFSSGCSYAAALRVLETSAAVRDALTAACASRDIALGVADATALCVLPVLLDGRAVALVAAFAPQQSPPADAGALDDLRRIGRRFTEVLGAAGGTPFWERRRA